jgi:XRE family aerobic/anaerobic benzoate catabolism transcriptional regulator
MSMTAPARRARPRARRRRPDADAILATLGRRARERRQARQLTLRALADRSGLSLRFLMDVEAGRGNISIRRLADLAAALDTTPSHLVTTDADSPRAEIIALLGLRGAGKTTIGRRLARKRRLRFVELDREVERRAGLGLSEMFSMHGEDYYRRLEHETLVELVGSGASMVIAAGGGIVTSPDAFALLRSQATTIWLKARAADHWQRVLRQGDRRMIDEHPHAREALERLLARREPLYARADHTVDTSGVRPSGVLARVEALLA